MLANLIANVGGKTGQVVITSASWTELTMGMASRLYLWVQNKSDVRMVFTTDTTKAIKECPEIGVGDMVVFPVSIGVKIYGRAKSGTWKRVSVMELA